MCDRAASLSFAFRVENDVDPTVFHRLEEAAFWDRFERRYGPSPLLQSPQVRLWVYPTMKRDFEVCVIADRSL